MRYHAEAEASSEYLGPWVIKDENDETVGRPALRFEVFSHAKDLAQAMTDASALVKGGF
jgi:hypothetical protein